MRMAIASNLIILPSFTASLKISLSFLILLVVPEVFLEHAKGSKTDLVSTEVEGKFSYWFQLEQDQAPCSLTSAALQEAWDYRLLGTLVATTMSYLCLCLSFSSHPAFSLPTNSHREAILPILSHLNPFLSCSQTKVLSSSSQANIVKVNYLIAQLCSIQPFAPAGTMQAAKDLKDTAWINPTGG